MQGVTDRKWEGLVCGQLRAATCNCHKHFQPNCSDRQVFKPPSLGFLNFKKAHSPVALAFLWARLCRLLKYTDKLASRSRCAGCHRRMKGVARVSARFWFTSESQQKHQAAQLKMQPEQQSNGGPLQSGTGQSIPDALWKTAASGRRVGCQGRRMY